jgi:hypothetical protein
VTFSSGETSVAQTVSIDAGTGLNSLMHDMAIADLTCRHPGLWQSVLPG